MYLQSFTLKNFRKFGDKDNIDNVLKNLGVIQNKTAKK